MHKGRIVRDKVVNGRGPKCYGTGCPEEPKFVMKPELRYYEKHAMGFNTKGNHSLVSEKYDVPKDAVLGEAAKELTYTSQMPVSGMTFENAKGKCMRYFEWSARSLTNMLYALYNR